MPSIAAGLTDAEIAFGGRWYSNARVTIRPASE